MARRFAGYLLMVALLSSNFSSLFVFAGFELNHDYIATHLCINRDKPWLHCNGHCYFMRKIKQAQEKEKSTERQSQKNLVQDALFGQKAETRFYTQLLQQLPVTNHHSMLPSLEIPIFQPPQLG